MANDKNNKKTIPIIIGTVLVLGIGGFLVYNYYASTNTKLILNNTASEFKNEVGGIDDSNQVINTAKTILADDYTIKVGTKSDDMFVALDYTKETNSYNALVSAYGFENNLDLGELPFNLTTKGFEYTGQSQDALDELQTRYAKSLATLFLESEVSNEKSDKPITLDNSDSNKNKTYDREIKFVINKDELNTLITSYDTEMSDITKNQIVPEIIQVVNDTLGIPLAPSVIEEYYDDVTSFYDSITESNIESDVEVTLYTDNKKIREIVMSTVADGENNTVSLFFNDVNNYLNSDIILTSTLTEAGTGVEDLTETLKITPTFNTEVWSIALNTTETSSGVTDEYSAKYTWNLTGTADNVVFEQTYGGETSTSTFTLIVDENQNIYYNKQGSLFNVVASLSRKAVTV